MNGISETITTENPTWTGVDTPLSEASAVSWGAIVAGAAAAAALSLILLILGTGLGLSSVSPWAHEGVSAATFGVSTILWITITQLLASGMGGYLAGRLRTRWLDTHTDEVHFRDTAHGFLAWAVASLATAALLTSAIGSIVNGGVQAGASVAGGAAASAIAASAMTKPDDDSGPLSYSVESLFRKDAGAAAAIAVPAQTGTASDAVTEPNAESPGGSGAIRGTPAEQATAASVPEVARIFVNSIRTGALPGEDVRYVGMLVAERTGMTQQESEKRVSDTYARMQTRLRDAEAAAKDVADKARKASAYSALWLFISLLIGAFVASLAATFGGRQRDCVTQI